MTRFRIFWLLCMWPLVAFVPGSSFESAQKSCERVRGAFEHKGETFYLKCAKKQIPVTFRNMFIRVFKHDRVLEIWMQDDEGRYIKYDEFSIAGISGTLGPKRQQGDAMAPEGFYYINVFNPWSQYHLSLGINYPNASDSKLSTAANKGGSIFIHGGNCSAGCLAMTNAGIEEIYLCAVKARANGQEKIPVHIFPFRMTAENLEYFQRINDFKRHKPFWENLREGFNFFEQTGRIPDVKVAADGYYRFNDAKSTGRN